MNPEHRLAQILLRSWPFPRGAGRLLDTFFGRTRFSEEFSTVKTTDGFLMKVSPNDLIGRHIYLTGEFDRSIVEMLCKLAKPGDVLLDIGANIGYVSACFLHNVKASTVIAIEPQQSAISLLRANLASDRSSIYPYALADKDGPIWFETNSHNIGQGRIVAKESLASLRIEARCPATMFKELGVEKIDLIKIDAEGAENTIISACAEHFERLSTRAVIFEDSGGNVDSIAQTLSNVGYDTFGIKKSLMSLHMVPRSYRTTDYIALRRKS